MRLAIGELFMPNEKLSLDYKYIRHNRPMYTHEIKLTR